MHRKALLISAMLTTLIFTAGAGYVKHFGLGDTTATGTFVTTVTKVVNQSPSTLYFGSTSYSFTSSAESLLEQTVSGGSASSTMTGASSGTMQMLYAYSTTLDGTLSIFNNTAGTGAAAASVAMTARIPYEWDYLTSSGSATLNLTASNSLKFTAGTLSNGLTTSNTATGITAAALYP